MAKGEYNVSDNNKESENGNAIQDRVEIVNGNNNEAGNDDTDGYVGYGFKKDESINMKFTLPLIGIIHFDVIGKLFPTGFILKVNYGSIPSFPSSPLC